MDRFQNVATSTSRRTIGTYTSYADAQKAVDYLSDNKFAVEKTAIVAEGLKFVEQVTGRLNWPRVIGNGARCDARVLADVGQQVVQVFLHNHPHAVSRGLLQALDRDVHLAGLRIDVHA